MKNRLKVLRAERNWTQAQLAAELDVSRQTINAIEIGKFDPSLPLAFKFARLFDMTIEDIFEYSGESYWTYAFRSAPAGRAHEALLSLPSRRSMIDAITASRIGLGASRSSHWRALDRRVFPRAAD